MTLSRRAPTGRAFSISSATRSTMARGSEPSSFKGCPHTCPWCANPESLSPKIETVRRESRCLHCAHCQRDVEECPSGAWEQIGRDVTQEALLKEVLKDEIFSRLGRRRHAIGRRGVNAGRVCHPLLTRVAPVGIHTAIETAGDAAFSRVYPLARRATKCCLI